MSTEPVKPDAEAPEIIMVGRGQKKMDPEKQQELLRVLKAIFPEEFKDAEK